VVTNKLNAISNQTAEMRSRQTGRIVKSILFYAVVILIVVAFVFPFFWTILTSLKRAIDQMSYPPKFTFTPTLEHYQKVLYHSKFFFQLKNSLIISAGAVSFSLLVGLPAAYSIAQLKQRAITLSVLVVRMAPGMVYLLPLFVLYRELGLLDTHLGLIITHQIITLPLTIWIMLSFFQSVPTEIKEAATIDGATRLQSFLRIALPLCAPGVAVTTILAAIQSWNNFVFVLIIGGGKTSTLPMATYQFIGFELLDMGGITAAASLITLPILIISVVAQRWLVSGLTMGAVK